MLGTRSDYARKREREREKERLVSSPQKAINKGEEKKNKTQEREAPINPLFCICIVLRV